jgi:hypothetical protein
MISDPFKRHSFVLIIHEDSILSADMEQEENKKSNQMDDRELPWFVMTDVLM